jgi:hypothetical protein
MKNLILFFAFVLFSNFALAAEPNEIRLIKSQILKLAQSYQGQGDPDFSRQKSLEPLVQKLLKLSPQASIQKRLPILYGVWKQVWGPYDYKHKNRGVDPHIGVDEIYQAVFPGGYYYNISPVFKNGDRKNIRIGLLRGEYKLDPVNPIALDIQFTNYAGVNGRPDTRIPIWSLAELSESGKLQGEVAIVSTTIVKLFFGGGALKELYTDQDMRILYGDSSNQFQKPYLYVMTRVQ